MNVISLSDLTPNCEFFSTNKTPVSPRNPLNIRTFINPGLIFGILRYAETKAKPDENRFWDSVCATFDSRRR